MKKIKILLNQIIPTELIKLMRKTEIEDKSSPLIFNQIGERVKMMFLSSDETAHSPYSLIAGRYPKNILWDRYNYALDTHFYTSSNIFNIKNASAKKYAVLLESQVIIPHIYSKAKKNIAYLMIILLRYLHTLPSYWINYLIRNLFPLEGSGMVLICGEGQQSNMRIKIN